MKREAEAPMTLGQLEAQAAHSGNKYLTTEEVAELLRTSPESVRFWRSNGKGPRSFKVGRRVLYALEDVETFIATARGGAA
jgi:excisionase family DNA binding protein